MLATTRGSSPHGSSESPDRTSVAALVEMRSPEDRKRLEKLPEVRETLHNVQDGAYNLIITLYHEVRRVP